MIRIAVRSMAFLLFTASFLGVAAQPFTRADTLRGSLNANRTWWEVKRYDVEVTPDYGQKAIRGKTTISFYDSGTGHTLQVDLQQPLVVDSVVSVSESSLSNPRLKFTRRAGDHFFLVQYRNPAIKYRLIPGMRKLEIYYHGIPREAVKAPWDGGWIWSKDSLGRPWMSVACQGLGASVWYPCKDYQGDEPDNGASLTMHVPDSLVAVGNGRLVKETKTPGMASYTWEVKNPINNYLIIPSIGKYVHFGETYEGERGPLACDYWVMDYNLDKARKQFREVPRMLKAFEYWFGPYPFYEDSYKIVESPHLGMEHQSAVAYGNHYGNGYLGRDLSGTGEGLRFDFIIVHESGHEWFANNITTKDIADMWVHESFTNYSETLFLDYWFGSAVGNRYEQGVQKHILNDKPIIGPYGVNTEGSGDMYNKGGAVIHTIRQAINNDTLFRQLLRGLNQAFYHRTVTTRQIEDYISRKSGINFSSVFDQYLRTTQVPVLQWRFRNGYLQAQFTNCIKDFEMPVKLPVAAGKYQVVTVGSKKPVEVKTGLPEAAVAGELDQNSYIRYRALK